MTTTLQLGEAERSILLSLPRYHCLTEQQIRRLLGRKSRSSLHPILKRLVKNGYLRAAQRHPMSPYAYFLTAKGCTVAEHAGVPVTIRWKPSERKKVVSSDLAHTLLVSHALIGFQLLCQQDPSWIIAVSTHERDFKVKPLPLPNNQALAPDGWVELQHLFEHEKERYWFALEVQGESTWTSTTIREMVRKYIMLEEQGIYRDYFSLHADDVFWVLFLTTGGSAKIKVIKTAIERELTAQGKADEFATMFLVAPLITEGIVYNEPIWQQPFSQEEKRLWEWL